MKILLAAPPFSGHLHPIIGIAKRLVQDSNLQVTIVSTVAAKNKVEKEKIEFVSVLEGYDEKIEAIANPPTKVKNNPFKLYRQLKDNIAILNQLKNELELVIEKIKPDLIIADFTLPIAGIIAQEKGIKWYTTLPSPCVYESDGVPAYFGGLYPPTNMYQEYKHKVLNRIIKVFKNTCYVVFKKELAKIGLKTIYDKNNNEVIYSNEKVYALGMKELEFNSPQQKQFCYVGSVSYSPTAQYQQDIVYNPQKKYILVTMGTHLKFLKQELIYNIQKLASSYPEIEFHITVGDENNDIFKTLKNVHVYNYISYDKNLDNYNYVIHHGGTGILYECIKRGIPSIVFPQDYDQFDNAARLDYYNVALRVYNYQQLSLAIKNLLNNPQLLEKNKYYQKIYHTYDAVDKIYKDVKLLEIE